MIQHEFGHAVAISQGKNIGKPLFGTPNEIGTNREALNAENVARYWYMKIAAQKYGETSFAVKVAQRLYQERESH